MEALQKGIRKIRVGSLKLQSHDAAGHSSVAAARRVGCRGAGALLRRGRRRSPERDRRAPAAPLLRPDERLPTRPRAADVPLPRAARSIPKRARDRAALGQRERGATGSGSHAISWLHHSQHAAAALRARLGARGGANRRRGSARARRTVGGAAAAGGGHGSDTESPGSWTGYCASGAPIILDQDLVHTLTLRELGRLTRSGRVSINRCGRILGGASPHNLRYIQNLHLFHLFVRVWPVKTRDAERMSTSVHSHREVEFIHSLRLPRSV